MWGRCHQAMRLCINHPLQRTQAPFPPLSHTCAGAPPRNCCCCRHRPPPRLVSLGAAAGTHGTSASRLPPSPPPAHTPQSAGTKRQEPQNTDDVLHARTSRLPGVVTLTPWHNSMQPHVLYGLLHCMAWHTDCMARPPVTHLLRPCPSLPHRRAPASSLRAGAVRRSEGHPRQRVDGSVDAQLAAAGQRATRWPPAPCPIAASPCRSHRPHAGHTHATRTGADTPHSRPAATTFPCPSTNDVRSPAEGSVAERVRAAPAPAGARRRDDRVGSN